jgi:UDP-N-acetylglucosamine--N-acetylmuramyl-(pentapeptide) pyrophosphoryl-undecaprenol N-acetylglucosamine transferase
MTTLMVATTGGHLAQLVELCPRLPQVGTDRLWVTFDTPQSRSLLAGEAVRFIPFIAERDVLGVARGTAICRRLFAEHRVTSVVSTGSAIALAFLPYAAWRGIAAHYIESSARVAAPSLTGRLLARVPGIRLYRQYPHAATGRWAYGGSVFDAFAPEPGALAGQPPRRFVVTLGSVDQSFRRLLEHLLPLIPAGSETLWQTGHTPIEGLAVAARPFLPATELAAAMARADVVIAHAGCGSALGALNAGKMPILVPRDPARGELVDNHQSEIAEWLAGRGLALHRSPETLAPGDLEHAAACRVRRVAVPPPFSLANAA